MAHSESGPMLAASCSVCTLGAGGTGTAHQQLRLTATDSEENKGKHFTVSLLTFSFLKHQFELIAP